MDGRRALRFLAGTALLAAVPAGAPVSGQVGSYLLEPDLKIGAVEGPRSLTRVDDVIVDEDGRIYVSQPLDAAVKVFSNEGTLLFTLGGKGGGPGEFRSIDRIGFQGGFLYAIDHSLGRISWFDRRTGTFVRSATIPEVPWPHPIVLSGPRFLLSNGDLLVLGASLPEIMTDIGRIPAVRADLDGAIIDTLQPIWWRDRSVAIVENGMRATVTNPLHSASRFDVSPDGWYYATLTLLNDSVFELLVSDAKDDSGPARYSFRYRRRRVPSDLRDSIMDALYTAGRGNAVIAQLTEADFRDRVRLPQYLPPVRRISATADGMIWMEMNSGSDGNLWLVVDERGQIVKRVSGDAARITDAHGGYTWGVTTDEFDVPYVRRYRLRKVR